MWKLNCCMCVLLSGPGPALFPSPIEPAMLRCAKASARVRWQKRDQQATHPGVSRRKEGTVREPPSANNESMCVCVCVC